MDKYQLLEFLAGEHVILDINCSGGNMGILHGILEHVVDDQYRILLDTGCFNFSGWAVVSIYDTTIWINVSRIG